MEGGKLTNPSQAVGWLEVALHPHLLLNSFPSPFWLSSFPSLLRSIPSPAHFSISCPGSFPRSLYLLLFPELCFPLTSCSSTCSTSRAVPAHGLVGLYHPTKELCPGSCLAHLPCCLPVSPGGIGGAQLPLNADGWKGRGNGGAAPRQRSLLALSLPRGGTHRQRVFSSKMVPLS